MGSGGNNLQRAISPELQQALYKVAGQDNGLEAILQFANQNSPASDKEKHTTQIELQAERIQSLALQRFNFVRVTGVSETGAIYYKPANSHLYRELSTLDRQQLVIKLFSQQYGRKPTKSKIDAIGDSLEAWVDKTVEGLDNSIMEIANNLYWDVASSSFTATPDRPCFRQLFDKHPADTLSVDINQVSSEDIKVYYEATLAHLENNDGAVIPTELSPSSPLFSSASLPLSPFWTWANEDVDTFNDLLKSVASCFMKNKPKGAFILIGRTRNGKSSFVKMLHTMFGRRNTSDLRLTDLSDKQKNMRMLVSMLNAPDEEDEGKSKEVLDNQANFKSMSAHEPITLGVFYSQKPQLVATNFMSFFPMNDIPSWKGNGAEACMRRSLILMFRNDLSKYDNNGHNFEEETYTPMFYSRLLGVVLAIAHYYNDKPIKFSDTMSKDVRSVAEEVDNVTTYLDLFFRHFDSYSNVQLLYEDYKLWCNERDVEWAGKKVMMKKLKMRDIAPTNIVVDGEVMRVNKLGRKKAKHPFYETLKLPELDGATVREYITPTDEDTWGRPNAPEYRHDGRSVVSRLEVLSGKL